jgi:hypothetical protein
MRAINWMLLGAGLAWVVGSVIGGITEDIRRGQAGYDSVYYRQYVPYTSPMGSEAILAQVRNLPIGERAWVRSGAGCEYLVEHAYDGPPWRYHLAKVHEARSRWGLPCHEASWWRSGSIIADGGPEDCAGGRWRAWREQEGNGWVLRWKCVGQGEKP